MYIFSFISFNYYKIYTVSLIFELIKHINSFPFSLFFQSIRAKLTNQIADQTSEMMREEIPEALTAGEFVADGQVPMMEKFSKNHRDLEVVITDDMEIAAIQGM